MCFFTAKIRHNKTKNDDEKRNVSRRVALFTASREADIGNDRVLVVVAIVAWWYLWRSSIRDVVVFPRARGGTILFCFLLSASWKNRIGIRSTVYDVERAFTKRY
jgi:hypothetical protein